MTCKNCGNIIDDGLKFCPNCGAPTNAQQPAQPAQPVYDGQPVQNQPTEGTTGILVLGILGLVFSFSYYGSIVGLILSAIAMSKAKAYSAKYGILTGKAKTGRSLGKAGLIISIIDIALVVLITIVIIAAAAAAAAAQYNY